MVFKYGLGVLVGVLLLGCSSKENDRLMEIYTQKSDSYKMLQKTEKLQLKENNETTLLLTATYITKATVKNDTNNTESFLIGISSDSHNHAPILNKTLHISLKNAISKKENDARKKKERDENDLRIDTKEKKKSSLINKYLKPLRIESISHTSPLLNNIAFKSEWSKFYLLTFKHIHSNRLILKIESAKNKTDFLYFAKVAKYAL